jgi:hypothetical protein
VKSCKLSVTLVFDRFRDVQLHDGRVQEDSEAISRNSATKTFNRLSYQQLIGELYLTPVSTWVETVDSKPVEVKHGGTSVLKTGLCEMKNLTNL